MVRWIAASTGRADCEGQRSRLPTRQVPMLRLHPPGVRLRQPPRRPRSGQLDLPCRRCPGPRRSVPVRSGQSIRLPDHRQRDSGHSASPKQQVKRCRGQRDHLSARRPGGYPHPLTQKSRTPLARRRRHAEAAPCRMLWRTRTRRRVPCRSTGFFPRPCSATGIRAMPPRDLVAPRQPRRRHQQTSTAEAASPPGHHHAAPTSPARS
jgi:hypothetical protein